MQDRQGFIWIGTQDGLNRFDGYEVTTYRYDPDDAHSLSDNYVRDIVEDESGALWIATHGGGLNRFDPLTASFSRYASGDNTTFTVFQDHAGTLWIGSPPPRALASLDTAQVTALARGDLITPTFRSYDLNRAGVASPDDFRGGVQAIVEDADGFLWLAADLALVRFDPSSGTMTAYVPHPQEERLNALVLDSAGQLWVGGSTGLYRFDPATEQFTEYGIDFEVDALYRDGDTLWIGGIGLHALDIPSGRVTQRYVQHADDPHSLGGEVVTAIFKDAGGVLWVGTREGISTFDPRQRQFACYTPDPVGDQSRSDPSVNALAGGADGTVWMALPQQLVHLDPATGEVAYYAPEPPDKPFLGRGLTALERDRAGDVWTGAGDRVYRLDVASGTFTRYDTLRRRVAPGPPPHVTAIAEDARGDVWIAMALVGLHRFDRQRETFDTFLTDGKRGSPQTLASDRVSALHVGRQGGLWIGYRDGYLSRFDPETATFTHYGRDSSTFGWVHAIHEDETGQLWLATHSGLVRFDPSRPWTEAIRRYTDKDGLPAAYVLSLLAEGSGGLWLGTPRGLARFEPASEAVVAFDTADGLGGDVFNSGAALQAPDGRMFFGGEHGVTAFYPEQITRNPYHPPVVLTEIRLANEPVALGGRPGFERPIWATEHLTLRHDDDIVSFQFAALGYAAPHKQRYRYRLEGLETAWVTVDSRRRFATYTHLPAGEYRFRVQGTNDSGVWSPHEATLALTVLPAWWETGAFRVGLFLLVVGTVGVIVQRHIAEVRRRQEHARVEMARAILQTVLDSLDALIYVIDMDTHEVLFANAQLKAVFGEVEGCICWQILQEGQTGPCSFCTNAYLLDADDRPTGIYRWQFQNRRNGRWYTIADSAVAWIDGRWVRLSMAADITEYRETEQRLVAQQRLLAALDERERIGRELHDDLGQVMGYMSIQAQTVRDLFAQGHEAQAKAALHQLIRAARAAHDDVRKYILGIRTAVEPTSLDFLTALEHYLQKLEERYGLEVSVNWPDELRESPLSPAVETQLLRIIQESLTNVCKHAAVDTARLMFTLHPDTVDILIIDEGRGFDLTASTSSALEADGHFGLTIMRERAEGVGGSLDVQSQPGGGTQVIVRLPRVLEAAADTSMRNLRVLLVDDHDLYLKGLHNLLSTRGMQVVGLAHDGVEAQELAQRLLPDLILMDVDMPRCDGLEATRQIKAALPETKIVMLTVAADEETLMQALQNGAVGYLLKNLESRQFFDLLYKVVKGDSVLSPALGARMMTERAHSDENDGARQDEASLASLTARQREILALVADGLTNKEIAEQLFISANTVKYHVSQILERLQVQSRYELASYRNQTEP